MIKKVYLFILLQFVIQAAVLAQPPQLLLPKWKVGDSLLVAEKGSVQMTIIGMKMPIDVDTRYKIKVTAKDTEGYIIEVYDVDYIGMTGGGIMEPLIKELESNLQDVMKKAASTKLILRISPQGEVKDLLNWKEVQSMLQELGESLMNSMGAKYDIPKEKLDSITEKHFAKIDTKDEVMNQVLTPVEYLLSGYNIKYPLTGKLNVSAMIFSRMNYFELNHKGVPATLSTKTISRKATETQVGYDIVYNRQALLDYINNTNEKKSITKEMLDKMIISEDRSFNFNLTTTWPKKIKMNAHVAVEDYMDVVITTEYSIIQY